MLDKNALSQLKTLKQEIHDSIPRHTGIARATSGRYGFVNTEDKLQFFLSPDEMDKVFPGDTIAFRVETTGEGKQQAIIEKLISSPSDSFYGTYIIRGKGHFIEPDDALLNRWVFVPPAKRRNAKEGDLVRAHISQHPYPGGKAQAHIDDIIGHIDDDFIEHTFIQARSGIPTSFSEPSQQQVQQLLEQGLDDELEKRTDLTHLPFVTIDSAGTRDIDDALYAEARSQGWSLWIAIADPAALITAGSAIDQDAMAHSTSVYFPAQVIPMLPPELSEQLCSLHENEPRLAMVVEIKVTEEGSIESTNIHNAKIRSQGKLSYSQVAQLINGEDNDIAAELNGHLLHLNSCAQALLKYRQEHCLVMDDRPDYKVSTDSHGKAIDIVKIERNIAHRLVEECMLACNRSIANWLAEKQAGFFVTHKGIRTERIGDIATLLREQLNSDQKPKLNTLESYISWLQRAGQATSELPLRTIITRQLERSMLSLEAAPHFGLGFQHYTTFTSPLRKYNDLLLHRIIKALLNNQQAPQPTAEQLTHIQQQQSSSRAAANQTEQWLKLCWLQQQPAHAEFEATILHMNATSFTARLEDSGIEGVIDRRKLKGDWTFDSKTMTYSSGKQTLMLNQLIQVSIQDINVSARTLRFTLK